MKLNLDYLKPANLKENWKADIQAGFMVAILALPLSLGIAKASGFPAALGVFSAIVGGVITTSFRVSDLSIKGPAAGLITICSGMMLEYGADAHALQVLGAAIMIMAVLQFIIAQLKFGSLGDFFPHSAIHGMLAAIGIIIIAKQIPVLLGDDPTLYKGEGPVELLMDIPKFITHAHWHIAIVGIIGLIVMFSAPYFKLKILQKIPPPMMVLALVLPLSVYWHFKDTEPSYSLVHIGNVGEYFTFNFSFSEIGTLTFWKYVIMFLFVNSLESLLTVKAIDNLDPRGRTSDYDGDLKGLSVGNLTCGLMGSVPIISESVRSTTNIRYGAQSKLANLFHGVFLLLALLFLVPQIELIPNAALAAILIYAGYRLAAPKQFLDTYKIGKEQLAIFLVTIAVTLAEDLLLGIAAGIAVKLLFHLYNGAKLSKLFKPVYEISSEGESIRVKVTESAIFTNLIGFKKILADLPARGRITLDLTATKLIDHSFMEFITHFQHRYNEAGGDFRLTGLENHRALSDHALATKVLIRR